jgi:predicted metal-dependent hydrolase
MTDLVVRGLLTDLEMPVDRRLSGEGVLRTGFFNALWMSFPHGEQDYIDSVRNPLEPLPEAGRGIQAVKVRGLVGQQATHRRIHARWPRTT